MTMASGPMPKWRDQPLEKFNRASPNLRLIDAELTNRWQFFFNGCYVVRAIRGGKAMSIHSWGAAIDSDWSRSDRARSLEAIDWLITNSTELHISSVHDYSGSRIWHRDRQAWKRFNGHGTPNGQYIHYETTIEGWADTTPIAERDPGHATDTERHGRDESHLPPANDFPPFDPANGRFSLWPLNRYKPTLRRRAHRSPDVHDATLYLQAVLHRSGRSLKIDGIFGTNTDGAVRDVQHTAGLSVNGLVDPETWSVVDDMV